MRQEEHLSGIRKRLIAESSGGVYRKYAEDNAVNPKRMKDIAQTRRAVFQRRSYTEKGELWKDSESGQKSYPEMA